MFSFNSLHKGSHKASSTLRRFFALSAFVLIALSALLVFSGCPPEPRPPEPQTYTESLNGVWVDSFGSKFTINSSAKTIACDNYEGTIVNNPKYTAANGVLIIKFTKYWEADWSDYPDVTYTENTTNINKFGALYWIELETGSVKMADAYTGYAHTIFDTLAEAQTNFTLDRMSNYIDWSITSPYTKN